MAVIDRRSAIKLGVLAALAPGAAQLAACAQSGGASSSSASSAAPSDPAAITLDNVRDYIVGVDELIELQDGTKQPLICFDNAATTPALLPVKEEVDSELKMYGSIGRGFSQKSDHSTDAYELLRDKILEFVGADLGTYTCFYGGNTTDCLNKLASALIDSPDDIVLATRIEHHSNDLPWRERCKVIYAEVDELGRIIYDDIERLLQENNVKYVTVTAASNVTGYVTDVHRVAKLAHQYGAKIIVDGAQIVAHRKFSMLGDTPEENIDFFAFTAHKMYAPFGGGAVVGLTEVLFDRMPEVYGGGTVRLVTDDRVHYKEAPESYEGGSPNYLGVISMGKAIDILEGIGFDNIEAHEQVLMRKMIDGLQKLDNVIIYGDSENISDRVGAVVFNFSDVNTFVLATRLASSYGIATRRGAFCAHPYVWRLMKIPEEELAGFAECTDVNTAGMIRVSFGIYNTEEEVDAMLEIMPKALEEAKEDMKHYIRAEPAY